MASSVVGSVGNNQLIVLSDLTDEILKHFARVDPL